MSKEYVGTTVPNYPPRPIPVRLLVESYADGYAVFRDDGGNEVSLEILVARIPWAAGAEDQAKAEDIAEELLPIRFRDLWQRGDCLRAVASTAPLLPTALVAARDAARDVATLNAVREGAL